MCPDYDRESVIESVLTMQTAADPPGEEEVVGDVVTRRKRSVVRGSPCRQVQIATTYRKVIKAIERIEQLEARLRSLPLSSTSP